MDEGYGRSPEEIESKMISRSVKTKDRLLRRKKELEDELEATNKAITLFGEHPYLAEALDLLGKIRL